jgi:signal transduction histidine kinase
MERQTSLLAARGLTDGTDRLLSADDALAELQRRCGGTLPGTLAVPELLSLVQQGRRLGLRIAREFSAYDGEDLVSGFARIHPLDEETGGGCELLIENWQARGMPEPSSRDIAERLDAIDRACAEVTARLDPQQRIQLFQAGAPDTADLQEAVEAAPRSLWTDHVKLEGMAHRQPLHWRLLDGARCRLPGSERRWRARLLPLGAQGTAPRGFELLLVADHPLPDIVPEEEAGVDEPSHTQLIGSELAPVLRQPVARIIANAETIRARLAGPLRAEYSEYAGDIVSAGQHLNGLLDDLSDLEVVEAEGFTTAREAVDLADAAARAAGILGVRAQARDIDLVVELGEDTPPACAEFRRVLQILINLIGNAIAYSPEGSAVRLTASTSEEAGSVSLTVRDEGQGISAEQAARIFDKFERLGRENDGGSGLGLYISSRLAETMGGALELANPGEEGAAFRLSLPLWQTDAED